MAKFDSMYRVEIKSDSCEKCGFLREPYTGARQCPECGAAIGWNAWQHATYEMLPDHNMPEDELYERLYQHIKKIEGVEWDHGTLTKEKRVCGPGMRFSLYIVTLKGYIE